MVVYEVHNLTAKSADAAKDTTELIKKTLRVVENVTADIRKISNQF